MMEFNHKPVLFTETIESLAIRPEGVSIDGPWEFLRDGQACR